MNAVVNLNDCKEFIIIKLDDVENKIKIHGSFNYPYFCGKDVSEILGYKDLKKSLQKFVDADEKKSLKDLNEELVLNHTNQSFGIYKENLSYNDGKAVYINESGLYSLILASQAKFAKEFKSMVCKVILPSIRKYGEFKLNKELEDVKKEIEIKDSEINSAKKEIKELQNSQLIMKNFVENVKSKTKNGYIYIATSKRYAAINTFKVGKTDKSVNIRESGFNNSRINEDRFYICYYKKVYCVDKVEKILHELLNEFRDRQNKEIFILHYTYLKELVEMTVKNLDKPFEYINDLIKNKLVSMYNLRPIIPDEIEFEEEKLLLEEIREQIYSILDSAIKENNLALSRTELFKKLNIEYNIKQTTLWNIVKKLLDWKKSKIPIAYKDANIFLSF